MNHTDTPGQATCDEHPGQVFTEAEAIRHLAAEHPDYFAQLSKIETHVVYGRRARRDAARQARRFRRRR